MKQDVPCGSIISSMADGLFRINDGLFITRYTINTLVTYSQGVVLDAMLLRIIAWDRRISARVFFYYNSPDIWIAAALSYNI